MLSHHMDDSVDFIQRHRFVVRRLGNCLQWKDRFDALEQHHVGWWIISQAAALQAGLSTSPVRKPDTVILHRFVVDRPSIRAFQVCQRRIDLRTTAPAVGDDAAP